VLLSSLPIYRVGLIVWVGVLDRLLSSSLGGLCSNDVLAVVDDVRIRLVVVVARYVVELSCLIVVVVVVVDHSRLLGMMLGRLEAVCIQYL
jgi:hypothetical protein